MVWAAPGRRARAHRRRNVLAAVRLGGDPDLWADRAGRWPARTRRQVPARERDRALGGLPGVLGRAHRARRAVSLLGSCAVHGVARRHHEPRPRDGRRPGRIDARLWGRLVHLRRGHRTEQPRGHLRVRLRPHLRRAGPPVYASVYVRLCDPGGGLLQAGRAGRAVWRRRVRRRRASLRGELPRAAPLHLQLLGGVALVLRRRLGGVRLPLLAAV